MMFENITIGELTVAMASLGVIAAFLYRVFSFFRQVADNTAKLNSVTTRLERVEIKVKQDKDEILASLDDAKTLFCTGLSALIDNALNISNETELSRIKKQLDERKRYD